MDAPDDAPPACLRPDCDRPTIYGSPACADHWQAWRDEETARALHDWGMDRDAAAVVAEFEDAQVTSEQIRDSGWNHR